MDYKADIIIGIVVIPVIVFTLIMLLFPKYAVEIFGIEIASPIPPIP